jgi:hypothetical protein
MNTWVTWFSLVKRRFKSSTLPRPTTERSSMLEGQPNVSDRKLRFNGNESCGAFVEIHLPNTDKSFNCTPTRLTCFWAPLYGECSQFSGSSFWSLYLTDNYPLSLCSGLLPVALKQVSEQTSRGYITFCTKLLSSPKIFDSRCRFYMPTSISQNAVAFLVRAFQYAYLAKGGEPLGLARTAILPSMVPSTLSCILHNYSNIPVEFTVCHFNVLSSILAAGFSTANGAFQLSCLRH